MLDFKELEREFNEEWGEQFEEDEVYVPTAEDLRLAAELRREILNRKQDIMTGIVNHMLKKKSFQKGNTEEQSEYLYGKEELKEFVKQYTGKGGNLKKLRVGIVRDDVEPWKVYCYEVVKRKHYDDNPEGFESREEDECDWKGAII